MGLTYFVFKLSRLGLYANITMILAISHSWASTEIHIVDGHFKDSNGAIVILRGVNAAGNSKVPPFMPYTDPEMFTPLQNWGMNVVRLLFTWEAFEPSPGNYNEAYLAQYTNAVNSARDHGLYVIIDFHQDGFSRFSIGGCGDGFPQWAIPPFVLQATPNNGSACGSWSSAMIFDIGMHLSWEAFYRNSYGVRDRYLTMIKRVASHFSGQRGVIGYDMLNEPWGNEATDLVTLYEDAAAAIRQEDPTAILFVSPHALTSSGTQTKLRKPNFENFAYSPHYYDGSVVIFHAWLGLSADSAFKNMTKIANTWQVPLFLAEFGAPANTFHAEAYMDMLNRKMDETLISGAQWTYTPGWTRTKRDGWNMEDFSIVNEQGEMRKNFTARPYVRRISGENANLNLNKDIDFSWDHEPERGTTEFFVPKGMFGNPLLLKDLEEDLSCSLDTSGTVIQCRSDIPGRKHLRISRGTKAQAAARFRDVIPK